MTVLTKTRMMLVQMQHPTLVPQVKLVKKDQLVEKRSKKIRKSGERVTGLFNTDIPTYFIKYTKIFFGVMLMSNLILSIA